MIQSARLIHMLAAAFAAVCFSSCASTSDEELKPKTRLYNPGDELSTRPHGQGYRPSHHATPLGLPMSQ